MAADVEDEAATGGWRDRLAATVWGDTAHREDPGLARRRRLAVTGIVAIAAVSGLLSLLHALTIPPFAPADETAHLGYVLSITEGDIPRIDELTDHTRVPHMPENITAWTANHPPLLYAVLAGPMRLAEAAGAPLAGLYAGRLLVVASVAVGYLFVGWLATLLLPQRLGAAVAATGVAALVPNNLHIAGMLYNDGPAFAAITALLVAAVLMLRRGVSAKRLVALILLAVLAANLRTIGLAAAAGCAGAVAVAELLHGRGAVLRRALRGAAMAAGSGAVALASVAWFLVGVNLARYQSATGSAALLTLHQRSPAEELSPLARLVHPDFLRLLANQYWGRLEADATAGPSQPYLPPQLLQYSRWLLAAVLVAVVLVAAWRLLRGGWRRPSLAGIAAWALVLGWLAALVLSLSEWVQRGGGSHLRYLWPAVAGFGALAAVALTALPRRLGALAAIAFVAWQAVAAAIVLARFTARASIDCPGAEPCADVGLRGLAASTPVAAAVILAGAGLLALAGLAWWARSVWALADPASLDAEKPDSEQTSSDESGS